METVNCRVYTVHRSFNLHKGILYTYTASTILIQFSYRQGVEMVQYTPVYLHVQYTLVYRQGVEMVQYTLVYIRGQRWSSIHLCIDRGRDGIVYTSIYTGVEMVQYTPVYIHVQYTLVYRQGVEVVQYTLVYIQGQRWFSTHQFIYRGRDGLVYTSIFTGVMVDQYTLVYKQGLR